MQVFVLIAAAVFFIVLPIWMYLYYRHANNPDHKIKWVSHYYSWRAAFGVAYALPTLILVSVAVPSLESYLSASLFDKQVTGLPSLAAVLFCGITFAMLWAFYRSRLAPWYSPLLLLPPLIYLQTPLDNRSDWMMLTFAIYALVVIALKKLALHLAAAEQQNAAQQKKE